jgi:hypothetical protein
MTTTKIKKWIPVTQVPKPEEVIHFPKPSGDVRPNWDDVEFFDLSPIHSWNPNRNNILK